MVGVVTGLLFPAQLLGGETSYIDYYRMTVVLD